MNLPKSNNKERYISKINEIESTIRESSRINGSKNSLIQAQLKLDRIAEKFQDDDSIGSSRYKLYELQALIYFFQTRDEDALDFINQAIKTRGNSYARAEQIKKKILEKDIKEPELSLATDSKKTLKPIHLFIIFLVSYFFTNSVKGVSDNTIVIISSAVGLVGFICLLLAIVGFVMNKTKMKDDGAQNTYPQKAVNSRNISKQERRKKLIGLEGWLALFVVGTSIGVLLGIINLVGYGSTFNDLSAASSEATSYVNAITPALWFEILTNIISIGLAIWLIILLGMHKKLAKKVAIAFLVLGAVFIIIDYSWASSVFSAFNVTQYVQSELRKASSDMGRAIIAAFIWVPYFLTSKRVKATLTE